MINLVAFCSSVWFYAFVLIWLQFHFLNGVSCKSHSGVEPSPPPSRLASWYLGVWWTWGGLFSHHKTFPLHGETELQPCGTTSHQLHVQCLPCWVQEASAQRMWLYSNAAGIQQSGVHHRTELRSSGDWGGRADSAAAEPAEPGSGQNIFCQGAACTEDFESVSAPTRWEVGADGFHGNRQPGTDAALAHHLQSFILTQQAGRLLLHRYTLVRRDAAKKGLINNQLSQIIM